jgi:hypothetical protein
MQRILSPLPRLILRSEIEQNPESDPFYHHMPDSFLKNVTNCMEQSPSWEANSHSTSEEILRLLWNRRLIAMFTRACHWFPFWTRFGPVFTPYFSKICCNIILPSRSRSSEWSPSFVFSHKNLVCICRVSHACYMPRLSHLHIWSP